MPARRLACLIGLTPFLSAGAQGLDPSPASSCGVRSAAPLKPDTTSSDSRVLIRFSPGLATNAEDAFLARALGTLTADRIQQALNVDVRSRGIAAGPEQTDASSAVAEGRVLGVRFVLVGTVRSQDDRSIVSWRLVDARSGKEMSNGTLSQPVSATDSLVGAMTATLTRAFGKPTYVPPPQDRVSTPSRTALLSYMRALSEVHAFDRAHLLQADSSLQAAITADPKYVAARFRMAELSVRQLDWVEQRDAERSTLVRKGLWSIGSVLMRDPLNPRALALMGRLYLHSGKPQLALPVAAALERVAPSSSEAITLRAQALRAVGRDEEALRGLRASSPVTERSVNALMVRADLERRVGDPIAACRVLNRAVALDPLFAPAYVWRAVVRSTLGERREGWSDAEVATRLGREDWGELAGAFIDLSVRDTLRTKQRIKPLMTRAALEEAGWMDLLLRAAVSYGLNTPQQAMLVVRQIPCTDPRRPQLAREPLLRYLKLPAECSGAKPQPKA